MTSEHHMSPPTESHDEKVVPNFNSSSRMQPIIDAVWSIISRVQSHISQKLLNIELRNHEKETVRVLGRENIPDGTVIFAATHISNQDMFVVAQDAIGDRNIGIASQSTNFHDVKVAPAQWILSGVNLQKMFYPVSNNASTKERWWSKWTYSLDQQDIQTMSTALKTGKSMVIAWHRPTEYVLPSRAGVGAIILAHINNAPLIPSIVKHLPDKWVELVYLPALKLSPLTELEHNDLLKWGKGEGKLTKELIHIFRTDSERLLKFYRQTLGI